MRKAKRGRARGTDDRGRAGARGRPRHNDDATGWWGRWKRKRKRDGRLRGKRGRDCAMSGWWKIGRRFSGARAAEKVSKIFKRVIGNAI
jgi:hypothetical protein